MNDMCNLSDLIEERGIERGIERGTFLTLRGLVTDGILTNEEAAARMNISVERFRELCAE